MYVSIYITESLSNVADDAFFSVAEKEVQEKYTIIKESREDGLLPVSLFLGLGGEGVTISKEKKSFTVVYYGMLNIENRAITSGHEILGHGLGFYRGFFDELSQHINAVQMENLIRRNMGINNL